MSIDGLAYRAEESAGTALETLREQIATYEHDLRFSANRLQEAVARERTLLRDRDRLIHQQEALNKLLPCGADAAHRLASLTLREHQVMDLVLAGHANKWIAAELGLSPRTIEQHRAIVMKKTGSKGLAALTRFALAAVFDGAGDLDIAVDEPRLRRAG